MNLDKTYSVSVNYVITTMRYTSRTGWSIIDESGFLTANRDNNVYTLSRLDNLDNHICLASIIHDS